MNKSLLRRQGLGLVHEQLEPDLGRRHQVGAGAAWVPVPLDRGWRHLAVGADVSHVTEHLPPRGDPLGSGELELHPEVLPLNLHPVKELTSPLLMMMTALDNHPPNVGHLNEQNMYFRKIY